MAFKFSIPFYAFRLHLHPGASLLAPLADNNVLRLGQPLRLVAEQYANALQEKVLNLGNFRKLLHEYHKGHFYKSSLEVGFEEARDKVSYPEFSLEFTYFFNYQEKGVWGVVPSLGVEAFADDEETLQQRLEEAIRLDFTRKRRLNAVQDIVATIWFSSVELQQQEIRLQAPAPKELEGLKTQQKEQLLPQAANLLDIKRQVAYDMEDMVGQLARALKGKFNRNVLLVGPSGSGKTALVWELSRQQKRRRIKAQLWETNASTLIKELMKDTGWQENLSLLCQELSANNSILFVRNLIELFEVGKYEGNDVSMADFLRPFLSRGEINIISECTEEELAQIEIRSPNYISLFQAIHIKEPEGKKLEQIILKKIRDIASVRSVGIEEEAIREIIRLNHRFTPYAGMPGKPIRFLESLLINKGSSSSPANGQLEISRKEVIHQFCEETGMPGFMVDPALPMDAIAVKSNFNSSVFGQEAAVESVVDVLASVKTALTRAGKPIASLLFVGPTGVGKTELAKILAEFMFGNRERIARFDMSEFASPYAVARLVGASYFSDGLLTAAIRKAPFSVLLFDEIEKAHPTFFDLLLQILSEGRLTDNQGKLANFCSTIIIMTSNIGAQTLVSNPIGWLQGMNKEVVKEHFLSEVQKYFRPELFNRIDQVIPFAPLDSFTVRFVVEREIALFRKREGIQFRRINLNLGDEVLDFLAQKGYDGKYGARQLQRTIREELIGPLSRILNTEDYDDQLDVTATVEDGKIQIEAQSDPLGLELLLEEYTKISHADHASALRRQIEQMKEGHFYVRLLSELYILEGKKRKAKQRFWNNRLQSERYTYYLETRQHVDELSRQIEELEMKLALSSLNAGPYEPGWTDELEDWENAFFQLKVEVYTRLYPKANSCQLAVYGSNPLPAIDFYIQLFRYKTFSFQAHSVWFRESFYNEEASEVEGNTVKKKKREAYVKHPWHPDTSPVPAPEKPGDVLWGVEFSLNGACCYQFLKGEEGAQQWMGEGEIPVQYLVKVENEPFPTPRKLHRKDFYTKQAFRRLIGPIAVRDTVYKINREYNKTALLGLIMEKMEEIFRTNLDSEIL
ncbi:MAG: ATP-dependent Clp protease ATP-binding subunit [Lewinellaceae bacterium]|nr:ATP-dependent Clp protease ATP-binding subunit [Phaeodactylibacter sp.]MCB9349403.1 ATP-dependent Clp protease ATP-binding subunit [Lewinellaceae bacterium]